MILNALTQRCGSSVIALDTNIVSLFNRGQFDITSIGDQFYMPFVVLAEIEAGIAAGKNPTKFFEKYANFLSDQSVSMSVGLDEDVRSEYVKLYSYLRKRGTPVSPNDLWIAAECMALDLPLMTKDTDFENIPQLKVLMV